VVGRIVLVLGLVFVGEFFRAGIIELRRPEGRTDNVLGGVLGALDELGDREPGGPPAYSLASMRSSLACFMMSWASLRRRRCRSRRVGRPSLLTGGFKIDGAGLELLFQQDLGSDRCGVLLHGIGARVPKAELSKRMAMDLGFTTSFRKETTASP